MNRTKANSFLSKKKVCQLYRKKKNTNSLLLYLLDKKHKWLFDKTWKPKSFVTLWFSYFIVRAMAVVVVRVVVRSCKVVDFILIMYFVVNLFLHVILVCVNEIYFENVVSKIKSSNFNIVEIYWSLPKIWKLKTNITNIFFFCRAIAGV